MTMDDIIALAGAGFTKNDIISLISAAPAPAPAPAPQLGMPPVPVVTPPVLLQDQLTSPSTAGQAQSQLVDYAFQQGGYSGMPTQSVTGRQLSNNDQLTSSINALTRAVQANGISQSLMSESHVPTVDEMTAAIINPPSVMRKG